VGLDDQLTRLKTRGAPVLSLPYTQECNDVAMMLIQHHKASEFYERAIDQLEQMYVEAEDTLHQPGSFGPVLGAVGRRSFSLCTWGIARRRPFQLRANFLQTASMAALNSDANVLIRLS
jgi:hypothetical protein